MGSRTDDDDVTPHLNMAEYWHGTFEEIFQDFQDEWSLEPTKIAMPQEWRRFEDRAKVKFVCECGNSWTSMGGTIIFWFSRIGEKEKRDVDKSKQGDSEGSKTAKKSSKTGNVYSLRFKLFGQQCKRCDDEEFKKSRWYKEEVDKVLKNVHQKIGEAFYQFPSAKPDDRMRGGRMRRPHDSGRCQACREGQCSSRRGR